jgi:hypothetical protein
MYWKLQDNGWLREGIREGNTGILTDQNKAFFTAPIHWEIPLNIDFVVDNEKLDCKISILEKRACRKEGWMEEMKIKE